MTALDPHHLEFLFGTATEETADVCREYLDLIANAALFNYQTVIHYGGKAGETLYAHVLTGIFLLEQLRTLPGLTEIETRVLFTAYTVHDINKAPEVADKRSFSQQATSEQIEAEIIRLGLDQFFPEYQTYLADITSLVRGHPDHFTVGMERLFVKHATRYGLDPDRLGKVLLPLIQAADIVDLSHSLDERRQKEKFLSKLNAASDIQHVFVSHRLDEQRGILTNVLHNAIVAELREQLGLIPLLFYPEGVAYLAPRGQTLTLSGTLLQRIGKRAARTVAQMIGSNFRDFISRRPAGMKVDPKCLELGIPFGGEDGIWREMYSLLQRATFDVNDVASKVAQRTADDWQRLSEAAPEVAAEVAPLLETPHQLVPESGERLRLAELIRSYYLFLKDHFAKVLPDPWPHLYQLLDLPPERCAFYSFFGDRYDRAYVVTRDLGLSEAEVYRRIEADGETLLASQGSEDPNAPLLIDYLRRYATFSFAPPDRSAFADSLAHYVNTQHRQCVNCAAPFRTNDWMAADVRSDVTVQAFSNRLRGGPGEPKKKICEICHLQFLLEKLNYPTVRGEQTLYLHLFPYSFLTEPVIQGVRAAVRRVLAVEPDVRALHLNASVAALRALGPGQSVRFDFSTRTNQEKPHPYGLYLPRFSQSVGNLLIFPLNPGGTNDSARFLFALWYALLLQRHFGMKVLLSAAPVAPLRKGDFGDLYVDSIPLSLRGLLRGNDFARWEGESRRNGSLWTLWETVRHLVAVRDAVYNPATKRDEMLTLVQTLADPPLALFHTIEKLLEQRIRDDKRATAKEWLLIRRSQAIFDDVRALAIHTGGTHMAELSAHLETLAALAWRSGLRGRSLEKNSLMTPIDEIFKKLAHGSEAFDERALRAAIVEDIFEYLQRVADDRYRPGRTKFEACQTFVENFFDSVLHGSYRGNLRRLMADEKLLRSAFLFYVRHQIPRKVSGEEEFSEEVPIEAETG